MLAAGGCEGGPSDSSRGPHACIPMDMDKMCWEFGGDVDAARSFCGPLSTLEEDSRCPAGLGGCRDMGEYEYEGVNLQLTRFYYLGFGGFTTAQEVADYCEARDQEYVPSL